MSAKSMLLGIAEAGVAFKSDLGMYGMASYEATMRAMSKTMSTSDPAIKIAELAEAQVEVAWQIAQPHVLKVLAEIGSEIVSQIGAQAAAAVSGIAQSMSTVIPMVGGVVSWYSSLTAGIEAAKREANNEFVRVAADQFKAPIPSGIGLVPADLFYPMPQRTDEILDDELEDMLLSPFSIGYILAITTEGSTRELKLPTPPLGFPPGSSLYKHGGKLQVRTIPQAKRRLLRQLRHAITAARGVSGGDGGFAAWPIYLDLIAAESAAGRLTEETAHRGYRRFVGELAQVDEDSPMAEGIGKNTVSLATVWDGPFNSVYRQTGILYAWYRSNHPIYSFDIAYVNAAKDALKTKKR